MPGRQVVCVVVCVTVSNVLACFVFSCLRPVGGARGDLWQLGGNEGEWLDSAHFRLCPSGAQLSHDCWIVSHQQAALGGRTPRRRWSRRGGGGAGHLDSPLPNSTLTAKSMLDLRLLDSFQTEAEPEEQGQGDILAPPMRQGAMGAGLSRANPELGSTISLQVTTATAWVSLLSRGTRVLVHQPYDWGHFVVHPRPITGRTSSSCPIRAQMWTRSVCCMPNNGRIAELASWTGTTDTHRPWSSLWLACCPASAKPRPLSVCSR